MNRKLPRPRVDLKCKPFTYKVSKKILWPSRLGIHVVCKKVVVQTHLQLLEFLIQTAFLTMTPSEYVKVHVYLYLPTFWQKRALNRSSRSEVFCKKGGLRNFVKFTGKHLCQSLFFNTVVAGLFLTEHVRWLLLTKSKKKKIKKWKSLLHIINEPLF